MAQDIFLNNYEIPDDIQELCKFESDYDYNLANKKIEEILLWYENEITSLEDKGINKEVLLELKYGLEFIGITKKGIIEVVEYDNVNEENDEDIFVQFYINLLMNPLIKFDFKLKENKYFADRHEESLKFIDSNS